MHRCRGGILHWCKVVSRNRGVWCVRVRVLVLWGVASHVVRLVKAAAVAAVVAAIVLVGVSGSWWGEDLLTVSIELDTSALIVGVLMLWCLLYVLLVLWRLLGRLLELRLLCSLLYLREP